ncbi:MAG TPA: GWxTD domain-containing protein [Thermoanaerobaculia bacterium]|nr:GWxTD domain-containing protein [Thermoanaerobaculia bacterium]
MVNACGGPGGGSSATARAWAAGPARWLLLPSEERALHEVRGDAEARRFVEEFWRRRDPEPGDAANPARQLFEQRVAAADRQYAEEGVRGSLTDRGRALVLLGPPPLLRTGRRAAPAWRPARRTGSPMPVRWMATETWEYPRDALPPALSALVGDEPELRLTFLVGARTRLIEGEHYLTLAAQSLVRLDP